jgi:hypothetical protein
VALLLLLALGPGCETDEPSGGLVTSCLTYTAEKDPTEGEVTSALYEDFSDCGTAVVELVLTGVEDVWSVQFHVVYPYAISQIREDVVDVTESFLATDDGDVEYHIEEQTPGRAVVGVTRIDTGSNKGVTPTAEDSVVLRLGFELFAATGSGEVTFEEASVWVRTSPDPGQPLPADPPVSFSGGTLVILNY